MIRRRSVAMFAAALTITAGLCGTTPGKAAEPLRNHAAKKKSAQYHGEHARRVVKKDRYSDSQTDARADMADPSGDYKGYPNWARAALGPKFDD